MNDLVLTAPDAREPASHSLHMEVMRYVIKRREQLRTGSTEGVQVFEAVAAADFIVQFLATTKLAPALDGEPIFVLRAQDKIAPSLVLSWSQDAHRHEAHAKAEGASVIAHEMIAWQVAHPDRVKVPD